MVADISVQCLLLGFSSLRNPVLYLQAHPVAYMLSRLFTHYPCCVLCQRLKILSCTNIFKRIKLNIEMSMANLVARLTRGSDFDEDWLFIPPSAFSKPEPGKVLSRKTLYHHSATLFVPDNSRQVRSIITSTPNDNVAARREELSGMKATKDVLVTVQQYENCPRICNDGRAYGVKMMRRRSEASLDEIDLQAWHFSEPSKLELDTKIFDNLEGYEPKSSECRGM